MEDEKRGVEGEAVKPSEKQQPVNLDSFEEFRKYKSARDKADADIQRQLAETRQQLEETQTRMEELIQDPAAKAQLKTERLQAKLATYESKDRLAQQRQWFETNWGVPAEALAGIEVASELTRAAGNYLRAETQRLQAELVTTSQEKETERIESEGGHNVSTTPGTPPERQMLTDTQIDKEISNLMAIAHAGGSAGEQARVAILELERKKQKGRPARARV